MPDSDVKSQSTDVIGRTVRANKQAPRAARQLNAHILHDGRHSRQRPPIYPAFHRKHQILIAVIGRQSVRHRVLHPVNQPI